MAGPLVDLLPWLCVLPPAAGALLAAPLARAHRRLPSALGLAACAHLSAVLFLPFFAGWLWSETRAGGRGSVGVRSGVFLAGVAVPLALLGLYNLVRFGDPLQTGRTVDDVRSVLFGYGHLQMSPQGIWQLLLGPGKSLLLYCPVVLLAIPGWFVLRRQQPRLWAALLAMAVTRWWFFGLRSDWSGGYGLGPRYLVPLVPFLLLPLVFWLRERRPVEGRWRWRILAGTGLLCISQQACHCAGEVFYYYHVMSRILRQRGVDPFLDSHIHVDWGLFPLRFLFRGPAGPWWGQHLQVIPVAAVLTLAAVVPWLLLLSRRTDHDQENAKKDSRK